MRKIILSIFLVSINFLAAQTYKDQLIGRVLDIFSGQGIGGVQVELITDKSIVETNPDGVFIFNKPNGFQVGEAYSFNLYKEGYLTVGHTDNIALYRSGAINDFAMKPDIDKYLWLTVIDRSSGALLKDVKIQIRDSIENTNANGLAKLDLRAYRTTTISATIRLDCYHDEIVELPAMGERTVKLIPKCADRPGFAKFDISKAQQTLDRALEYRDGSLQGQTKAVEGLLAEGYVFSNTDFDGVAFPEAKFGDSDFTQSSFQVSNLRHADFTNSKLDNANFNFTQIEGALLDGAIARETYFQYMEGKNSRFRKAKLSQSSFLLSDLSGADFSNADLKGACLAFCDLTGANFSGADLTDAYFHSSVLNKANFKDAIIKNTEASIAVADTIHLTDKQRKELRRIAPPANIHQVRIWGNSRDEAGFDHGRPDFKLSAGSFGYAHFRIESNTLSFRDDSGINPIGAFQDHSAKGQSYVDTYNNFNSHFWNTANRGKMIKSSLTKRVRFLRDNLGKQKVIEGLGEEMTAIMGFLRKKKSSVFKGPLIWDEDAQLVFSIATGLKDTSEIRHYDWEKSAKSRCRFDKRSEKGENSWDGLYPLGCHCDFLPYEHLKIYKKWTLDRASRMKVKKIEIAYPTYYTNIEEFIKNYKIAEAKNRGILFKRGTSSSGDGISSFFHNKSLPYKQSEFYMTQPVNMYSMYLKLPKNKFSYYIDLTDLKAPKLPANKSKYDYPLKFSVQYEYNGIETVEKYNQQKGVVLVSPLKAILEMDGKVFWEGKIFQIDETLYDPAAHRKNQRSDY